MNRDALWSFQGEKTTQKLLSLEEYAVKEKLNIAMYCNLLQSIYCNFFRYNRDISINFLSIFSVHVSLNEFLIPIYIPRVYLFY